MYLVINQGKIVGSHTFFFDAWLQACVDYPSVYSFIQGPDGTWIVNPKTN